MFLFLCFSVLLVNCQTPSPAPISPSRSPPAYQFISFEVNGTSPSLGQEPLAGITQQGDGLFIMGGVGAESNVAFLLNLTTNIWHQTQMDFSFSGGCVAQSADGLLWWIDSSQHPTTYNITSGVLKSFAVSSPVPVGACYTANNSFYIMPNCSSQIWVFSDPTWHQLNISSDSWVPPARQGASLYVQNSDEIWLVGGQLCAENLDPTLFIASLDVVNGTWIRHPNTVSNYQSPTIVFDPMSESMILFGGITDNTFSDSVWQFQFQSFNWTDLTEELTIKPTARSKALGVWARGRILISGGFNSTSNGVPQTDTWQLVLNEDCFTDGLCDDCLRDGCGWCYDNIIDFQCVAGLPSTGPYSPSNCVLNGNSDRFILTGDYCADEFPGWIISLIIIGCIVLIGILVYVGMRMKIADGYQAV